MKSITASVIAVAILLIAAALLWAAGNNEERLAAAEYTLVTLRYERAAAELDAATSPGILDPVLRRISSDVSDRPAMARYWSGDYEEISQSDDLRLRLLAANAEYRTLRGTGGPWQTVVARLDAIGKRYADILRADPGNEDAAYNYEFVLRYRAAVVAAKQPLLPSDVAESGLTLHGIPGAPPQDSDAKKFKMIVPMMPDERQEAEEAGRAPKKVRKG
jgi:hypothetical protein